VRKEEEGELIEEKTRGTSANEDWMRQSTRHPELRSS